MFAVSIYQQFLKQSAKSNLRSFAAVISRCCIFSPTIRMLLWSLFSVGVFLTNWEFMKQLQSKGAELGSVAWQPATQEIRLFVRRTDAYID